MKPTRANVERRAAELGCTFFTDNWVWQLTAPEGMIFATSGCHYSDFPRGEGYKAQEVYASYLEEMREGLVPAETTCAT